VNGCHKFCLAGERFKVFLEELTSCGVEGGVGVWVDEQAGDCLGEIVSSELLERDVVAPLQSRYPVVSTLTTSLASVCPRKHSQLTPPHSGAKSSS